MKYPPILSKESLRWKLRRAREFFLGKNKKTKGLSIL